MGYTIMTDSACNLPLSMLEKENAKIIPMTYYAKDDSQHLLKTTDIDTFDGTVYYDRLRDGHMYNTSQISPQEYYEVFEPYVRNGEDILFISMSSGISGSFNSAMSAKQMIEDEYPKAHVLIFDSLAASLGEGLQVLKAIEYKKCGLALQEAYQKLLEIRDHMYQVFTVENLKHLQRTGRLSNAAAIIGTVLNIRPILKGNDKGQIVSISKARGSKNAIRALAEKYRVLVENAAEQIVGIAHADNWKDAELLKELLNEFAPPKDIITVCYEPVTGSHVGPDAVALFFLGGASVRSF